MAQGQDVQEALVELTQGFNSLNAEPPASLSKLASYYQTQFSAEYQKRSQKPSTANPYWIAYPRRAMATK